MAKKLSGFTTCQIANESSGGAIGTTYSAVLLLTENGSITWEPAPFKLGDGNEISAGGTAKFEIEFLDGAASLATLANIRTDSSNSVLCKVKVTSSDSATYELRNVYIHLAEKINQKSAEFKLYTLKASKFASSYSSAVTEA